jgi:two-component system chemotaxis sensor kinase CheA
VANERRDSFQTLMETTPNYIAMVDELNRVTNISSNLAKLTRLENPDLAIGRPVIDFFPSMEMKELAGDLLRKTARVYEEMWECWIDGEHRYFKALGDELPDEKGILINLIDMTHLAERDEIVAMKDSLDIGLFFMDRDFIIQDNYSKALPRILGIHELHGKSFLDVLAESVMPSELTAIEDYFGMVFEKEFDREMLNDINPLNEFQYCSIESKERKILHVEFITVERGHGEVMIMASIYDITAKVELQKRLAEEEKKRQEEMRSLFELINVEPKVFNDFIEDVDYEFKQIDSILKNHEFTQHEILVEIYKSIHAIKSNAVILGLATFGGKVHALESEIKHLREAAQDVPFDDMLHLTLEIEKLMQEKENFRVTLSRINTFRSDAKVKSNDDVLIEALTKACSKASEDLAKKVNFIVQVEPGIIDRGPRRVIKDVLMQLVRNSVVHGVESPEERVAKGKDETGTIRLSIKAENNMIYMRLRDDGGGINYDKIRQKALTNGFIKNESEGQDKNKLLQCIFSPGFSTADTETVHGGRGIGLNIVRDKVRELGGSLKVQSEKDKGTAFNLYIPLSSEGTEQEKAAS